MNYIKVVDKHNCTVLINLDMVTAIYGTKSDTTVITYGNPDENTTINIKIQNFKSAIENHIGTIFEIN